MKLKILAATALALATFAPANAAELFTVNIPVAGPGVPGLVNVGLGTNDFLGGLAGVFSVATNAVGYASNSATLTLSGPAIVSFYLMGAESGYTNTFTATNAAGTVTATEHNETPFLPRSIGSLYYAAGGAISGSDWKFTTASDPAWPLDHGVDANIGQNGFGFFMPLATAGSSYSTNTLYFGFDDQQYTGDDDNHDDMIIMAQITPVPEAATWAMLLSGFAVVGAAMRRRRTGFRAQQAV